MTMPSKSGSGRVRIKREFGTEASFDLDQHQEFLPLYGKHKGLARIAELYVNQDKTLDEVIQIMAESGFHATNPQYIRKVNVNWKLQKNYTKEQWQFASALVEKRQADGKLTQLSIDGKVISEKRRKKELKRYHVSQIEEEFTATNASGVLAHTPPPSNSRVVLINGLPWLKFRESFSSLTISFPIFEEKAKTMLCESIWNDDEETFNWLIERFAGAELDLAQPEYPTPLWLAVHEGEYYMAERLVNAGANPNKPSLEFLINHGSDVNMPSVWGVPLGQAARGARGPFWQHDAIETCQLLLAAGADVNASIGSTALESAVARGHVELAKLFIEAGADVNASKTALQVAVLNNNTDLAKLLVEAGANLNTSPFQISALRSAVINDSLELVALFLAEGADINELTYGKTVLQNAASLGKLEMVKYLIDRGADVDAKVPSSLTALQYAAMNGSVGIVKYLVEHGASVDEKASPFYKATALGLAIDKGHTEAAIYLIEKGASIDKRTTADGETPLQLAAKHGDHEIVTYLVEKGAAVNAAPATKRGATALQFAAINGNIKMAILLLENGAHVNAKEAEVEGRTALEGAAEYGRLDMIYLLLDNDEEPDTIEERCCHAAEFAEAEHHDVIARILRNYKKP
ncbi:ankyrin protein [Fusarium bulbicola]|nr:ankyrin protein [Fusarium bulbicola]